MLLPTSEIIKTEGELKLIKGDVLPEIDIAFETWGTLNEARDNAVLVCHGFTNNQHAAGDGGWYAGVIGPGKAVDTDRWFVIAPNMLGSAHGTTGPNSIDPRTGEPYALDFPEITVPDMVNAQLRLLDHFGIEILAAVIGNSFGGFLAFEWGTAHPDRIRALIPVVTSVSGANDPSPVSDEIKQRFIESCPGWNGGRYYGNEEASGVFEEMLKVRMETLTDYGFKEGIRELSEPWAKSFDANSLIVLRRASEQYNAEPNLDKIKVPVLYVLSRTDNLFQPSLAPAVIERLKAAGVDASYHEIDSENGHRAPAIDPHLWSDQLGAFMERLG